MSAADTADAGPPPPRRRVNGWAVFLTFLVLVVVVIGLALWIGLHAVSAGERLSDTRDDIKRVADDLRNGDSASAKTDLAKARRDAHAADADTHDPAWALVSWLPPVHTVRGLSSVANSLVVNVLTPVVQIGPTVTPSQLRVGPDRIALAPLTAAAPTLTRAATAAVAARAQLAALPAGWLGIITTARDDALHQVTSLGGSLDDSARFARAGPSMLGADGQKRYFIGIQNNAETRGTGGYLAAYAIMTANNGTLHVVRRGIDADLKDSKQPAASLGSDYQDTYGRFDPTTEWRSSNVSPNFPDAATIWANLWQAQTGQHIDGAIAVDPLALQSVLGQTGPVYVKGYPQIFTGLNLASFIESGEYSTFADTPEVRKPFVGKVAATVLNKLLSGAGSPSSLVTALAQSAGGGHLQIWSANPTDEAQIVGTPLAGELPKTAAPFAAVALNNATGSKLDYYLDRSLTYSAPSCGSGGRRLATITVRLDNEAPLHGLPDYVRIRADQGGAPETVPIERVYAYIYATNGAVLRFTTVNGRRVSTDVGNDQGHPAYFYDLTLRPGVPTTVVVSLIEPVHPGSATTKVQPMFRPQTTSFESASCS